MIIYNYDKLTKEYTRQSYADLDPEETKQQGKNVYLIPANATTKKPPKAKEHEVVIYNNGWEIVADYRGLYMVNSDMQPLKVDKIGALPEGYAVATEEQAQKILEDDLFYIVQDRKLVENPDYEKQKEEQRKEQISRLAMTKYDFFKFVCQPNDVTYSQLCQLVQSNEEVAAAWDLCGHVYRGDYVLCKYIKEFLPAMTDDVLDEIFEQHGKVINE